MRFFLLLAVLMPASTRNMMRVCRKEGTNNPDLWVQVLSHLVENASSGNRGASRESSSAPADGVIDLSSEDEEEDRGEGGEGKWDDVRELLALIERDQVLPPLKVREVKALVARLVSVHSGDVSQPRLAVQWDIVPGNT